MKELLKKILRPAYYEFYYLKIYFLNKFFSKPVQNIYSIPIIINNRNRITSLIKLIEGLEKRGYTNIHIIDNDSTYLPLLQFYKETKYKVYFLNKNLGFLALWKSKLYKQFIQSYYVYTDSDVVLIEECPNNFLEVLYNKMKNNVNIYKIGLSIKIDDIPDWYVNKTKVIEWESRYYKNIHSEGYYRAHVDTTFALYRPWYKGGANIFVTVLRAAFPFQIKHLPWYNDSKFLSEEEMFYISHAETMTHWTENK